MKGSISLFAVVLLLITVNGFAGAPSAGTVLAEMKYPVPGASETLVIKKIKVGEDVTLVAINSKDQTVWTSTALGIEEKQFRLDGKPQTLALVDLDKDGVPEVLTSAFYGPKASGLYTFKFGPTMGFIPIPVRFPKVEDLQQWLISDLQQSEGTDMEVTSDGKATILGMIYSATGEEDPAPGKYTFALEKGEWLSKAIEKLPAPPPEK